MEYEFTKNTPFGRKGKRVRLNPNSRGARSMLRKGMIVERETKVIEPEEVKPKRRRRKKVTADDQLSESPRTESDQSAVGGDPSNNGE